METTESASGGTLAAVADALAWPMLALHLGLATVRTHLLAIRRKTGHADLPSLVASLGRLPPLLPPPPPPAAL